MFQTGAIVALAIGYVGALFAIAWLGDRLRPLRARPRAAGRSSMRCRSASTARRGRSSAASASPAPRATTSCPVYIGPILLFAVGWPLILRIVRLAKSQNLTSVADFLAARYGKSPAVAAHRHPRRGRRHAALYRAAAEGRRHLHRGAARQQPADPDLACPRSAFSRRHSSSRWRWHCSPCCSAPATSTPPSTRTA